MNNKLVGLWRLKTWKLTDSAKNVTEPFGSDALGVLIYTEYGFMSVHLMKANTKPIESESPLESSPEEAFQLMQSYSSYCGKYSIDTE